MITEAEHKELIDAMNLICKYVAKNMKEGWELILTMSKDEAYLDLYDEEYEIVETSYTDYGVSCIATACEVSNGEYQ